MAGRHTATMGLAPPLSDAAVVEAPLVVGALVAGVAVVGARRW